MIANNEYGIYLFDVLNNNIRANYIANNNQVIGIFADSQYNNIYYNNFISNSKQVKVDPSNVNVWDNNYPNGGNYWSDYIGIDANSDGIGDTPIVFDEWNQDNYPLMEPTIQAIPDFAGCLIFPFLMLATFSVLVLRRRLEETSISNF